MHYSVFTCLQYKLKNSKGDKAIMEQSTLNFIYFLAVIGAISFAVFIAKLLWVLVKMILPNKNYGSRYG
jgi:hypothetical protein